MKRLALTTVVIATLVTFLSIPAHALTTLALFDGTTTIFVADDGTGGDITAGDGVVTFNGIIGTWTVNVSTGITKPSLGSATLPIIHLNSVNMSTAPGELLIFVSETDFSSTPFPSFVTSIGGVAGGIIEAASFLDDGNDLFELETLLSFLGPLGPGAFSATATSPLVFPTDPFSVTLGAIITHGGSGAIVSSFDLHLAPTPEPGTLLLLGTGLVGLYGFGRLRQKRQKKA